MLVCGIYSHRRRRHRVSRQWAKTCGKKEREKPRKKQFTEEKKLIPLACAFYSIQFNSFSKIWIFIELGEISNKVRPLLKNYSKMKIGRVEEKKVDSIALTMQTLKTKTENSWIRSQARAYT